MTRVLLLRHGATDLYASCLCGRSAGIHLNRVGLAQAAALATRFTALDELVTSPIERARETADAISRKVGLQPRVVEGFVEFDFGEWTGRSFEDLRGDSNWNRFNSERDLASPPGGESMADVQSRSLTALTELIGDGKSDRDIAIVSHGDVIRALLLYAARCALRDYWRFTVDLASISELEVAEMSGIRIQRINDTAHLESLRG